jgi:hypothetical protein
MLHSSDTPTVARALASLLTESRVRPEDAVPTRTRLESVSSRSILQSKVVHIVNMLSHGASPPLLRG